MRIKQLKQIRATLLKQGVGFRWMKSTSDVAIASKDGTEVIVVWPKILQYLDSVDIWSDINEHCLFLKG